MKIVENGRLFIKIQFDQIFARNEALPGKIRRVLFFSPMEKFTIVKKFLLNCALLMDSLKFNIFVFTSYPRSYWLYIKCFKTEIIRFAIYYEKGPIKFFVTPIEAAL